MLERVTAQVLGLERFIGTGAGAGAGAGASAALVIRWEINLGGRIEHYEELCLLLGRVLLRDCG